MNLIFQAIESLREEIREHEYRYYVLSSPIIDDRAYDRLMRKLEDLESQYPEYVDVDSPTQRVGNDRTEGFARVEHRYPMLSLSNTYSYAEVADFYRRCLEGLGTTSFVITAELKFDGLSISLIYHEGRLARAVTRGDGRYGDDVTANIRTIRSIPLRLLGSGYPSDLEIRGEVLLPFASFHALNTSRGERGETLFANPRNAASGTLKQLDASIVADRGLDAYFYYVPAHPELSDSHYERLEACRAWGLKVSDAVCRCHTQDQVYTYLSKWQTARRTLPVATDGVVLKVDSISQQEELGYTAKSPRWAIAYKFETERTRTRLLSVDYQVGRTGAITPVANLEPVQISGTMVRRASLHNADIIRDLDLHSGDYVYVEKGGEIIPKIVGVDESVRSSQGKPIAFVDHCPDCRSPLIRIAGEAAYYCPNRYGCPTQQKGRVEHYASRRAAAINIGPETIDLLFERGLIHTIADLYRLSTQHLIGLPGFSYKAADNLVSSIDRSRTRPFAALLFGLGIRYVGETVSRTLAATYHSIECLATADQEALRAIDTIGDKIAASIMDFFADEANSLLVQDLISLGVKLEQEPLEQEKPTTQGVRPLAGLTIVISGVFTHRSREDYKQIIEQLGGRMASSISAKTSFVLMGENMGPAKREKAEKLDVELLSENDFLVRYELD